jgi:DNA topoisomerase-2
MQTLRQVLEASREKAISLTLCWHTARHKQNQAMRGREASRRSLTGIAKLDDGNAELQVQGLHLDRHRGDSAKSLAMSVSLSFGRDFYGVFPLKGGSSMSRRYLQAVVMKNEEIKNMVDIMGLKYGSLTRPISRRCATDT